MSTRTDGFQNPTVTAKHLSPLASVDSQGRHEETLLRKIFDEIGHFLMVHFANNGQSLKEVSITYHLSCPPNGGLVSISLASKDGSDLDLTEISNSLNSALTTSTFIVKKEGMAELHVRPIAEVLCYFDRLREHVIELTKQDNSRISNIEYTYVKKDPLKPHTWVFTIDGAPQQDNFINLQKKELTYTSKYDTYFKYTTQDTLSTALLIKQAVLLSMWG